MFFGLSVRCHCLLIRIQSSPFRMLRMQTLYTQYVLVVRSFSSLCVNGSSVERAYLCHVREVKKIAERGAEGWSQVSTLLCFQSTDVRQECTDWFHWREQYWCHSCQVFESAKTNVCPSARNSASPSGRIFVKFHVWSFSWNVSVLSCLKLKKKKGTLLEDVRTFMWVVFILYTDCVVCEVRPETSKKMIIWTSSPLHAKYRKQDFCTK